MAATALTNTQPGNPRATAGRNDRLMLTASQKAALIVTALGPEAAGPIIERIGDKHLRAFTRAYAQMQSIPREALKAVVEEFLSALKPDDNKIHGGVNVTREFLSQFKSNDEITALMEDLDAPSGQNVWSKLERADDEELADYLITQRPQIIAVILSKLNTEKASTLLNRMESDIAGKVILCLSRPLNIDPEALKILSDTIEREFLTKAKATTKAGNSSGEMIGAMLNNIVTEKREALLEVITASVPEIMKDVRKSMLTFPEIPTRVPPNAIPMAVREMEQDDFLLAVKYGRENAPESADFIFKNISQRMAAQYEEDMEKLNISSVEAAETAQAQFMSIIRGLAKSGEIMLIEVATEEADNSDSGDAE